MPRCTECMEQDYVYGLFTESGQFDLDIEFMAGIVAGGFAASKADIVLDKVEFLAANPAIKDASKIGLGVLLTQFGQPLLDGAGFGMVAVGATSLINSFMGGNDSSVDGVFLPQQQGTEPAQVYGQPFTGRMHKQQINGQPFTGGVVNGVLMPEQQGSSPAQVFGINGVDHQKTKIKLDNGEVIEALIPAHNNQQTTGTGVGEVAVNVF